MLFNFATVFVTAMSIAASSIPVTRQASNAVTCILVLDPQSAVPPGANLEAEFNSLIGSNLSIDSGAGSVVENEGATFSTNADGTFTVEDTVSVDGKPGGGGSAIIITGWAGEVKEGLTINWLVETASCN